MSSLYLIATSLKVFLLHAVIDTVIVTNNTVSHTGMVGSSAMLICTVRFSPVVWDLESGHVTVDIMWTGPDGEIVQLSNNEQLEFVDLNNILYMCYKESDLQVFRCEDFTYKSIITQNFNQFTPGFYNCTATITTQHPYINIKELSNGTRFTTG